jgi:hypothetical protein
VKAHQEPNEGRVQAVIARKVEQNRVLFGGSHRTSRLAHDDRGAYTWDVSKLRYGDHVKIENLGIVGEVIEADTRSVVVRYKKADGELVDHRVRPDDVTYIPKPHES